MDLPSPALKTQAPAEVCRPACRRPRGGWHGRPGAARASSAPRPPEIEGKFPKNAGQMVISHGTSTWEIYGKQEGNRGDFTDDFTSFEQEKW